MPEGFARHLPPGYIELTPYDPEFASQMEVAERVIRKRRNVLKKLAE